jgi:hypothetical protein
VKLDLRFACSAHSIVPRRCNRRAARPRAATTKKFRLDEAVTVAAQARHTATTHGSVGCAPTQHRSMASRAISMALHAPRDDVHTTLETVCEGAEAATTGKDLRLDDYVGLA